MITFYDAFHGVGGFRHGLEQAGMECVGGCEIDKYACQAYGVINDEPCKPTDITTVDPVRLRDFDVFVGGFPCQDLSIAGHRKGFEGDRSVLFFEILRICRVKRPRYILLENVTGLLSHNGGGETFEIVLKSLDELGYDAEWQVHNSAAYVPQNRERIFIIGHLRESGTRTVFPFGAENENTIEVVGRLEGNHDQNSRVYGIAGIAPTLSTMQGGGQEPKVLVTKQYDQLHIRDQVTCLDANYAKGLDNHQARTGVLVNVSQKTGVVETENAACLDANYFKGLGANQARTGVAIMQQGRGFNKGGMHEISPTITKNSWEHNNHLYDGYRIRKLTPLECFRLQSFPDWWYYTLKEHGISDSQLYKMAGNAVTSAVAYEIGTRIMQGEKVLT